MISIAKVTNYLSAAVVAPRRRRQIRRPRSGNPLIAGGLGVWYLPPVNQIKSLHPIGGAVNLSLSVCPCDSRSWIAVPV